MFGLGFPELLLIFLVVFILFGAKKLPQLGAGLGEGIRNFQKAMKGEDASEKEKKGSGGTQITQEPYRTRGSSW